VIGKKIKSLLLLALFLVITCNSEVFAANYGLIAIQASIVEVFNGILNFESRDSWWDASSSGATINHSIVAGGAEATQKALEITYTNPSDDSWSIVGKNLSSTIDMTLYESVSFYVKGDINCLQQLSFVLANDALGSNYEVKINPFINPSNYNPNLFNRITIPFDAFRASSGASRISDFVNLLKNTNAVQFKNTGAGSGTFTVDEVNFNLTLNPPYIPAFVMPVDYNLASKDAWKIVGINLKDVTLYSDIEDKTEYWWQVTNSDINGSNPNVDIVAMNNYKSITVSLKGDVEQFKNILMVLANDTITSYNNYGANIYDCIDKDSYNANGYNQVVIPFSDFRPMNSMETAIDFGTILSNVKAIQFRIEGQVSGSFIVDNLGFDVAQNPPYVPTLNLNFAGKYDFEKDRSNWWWDTAAYGATINHNIVYEGADGTMKSFQINYSNTSDSSWSIIGRALGTAVTPTVDLSMYNVMHLYVKGNKEEVGRLKLIIANDDVTSYNNYFVDLSQVVTDSVNNSTFTRISIPLSSFMPQGLFGNLVSVKDLLAQAKTIQFRVNGSGAGNIYFDELSFDYDANTPPIPTTFNFMQSFDMESYGEYWWSGADSPSSEATINAWISNNGVDGSKGLNIAYNSTDDANWMMVSRPFANSNVAVDLSQYDTVTLYVSGNYDSMCQVSVALANDDLTLGNNYEAFFVEHMDPDTWINGQFNRVVLSYSDFRLNGDFGNIVPIEDLIKNILAFQFKVYNAGKDRFTVDNISFETDQTSPMLPQFSADTLIFTSDDIAASNTGISALSVATKKDTFRSIFSKVAKAKSTKEKVSISKTAFEEEIVTGSIVKLGPNGIHFVIPIIEKGIVVISADSEPKIWLEMSKDHQKIYANAASVNIVNNIIRGVIPIDYSLAVGTGNLYFDTSCIVDLAGHTAQYVSSDNGTVISFASIVYAAELRAPTINAFATSFDKLDRRVPFGNTMTLTINVSDDTGVDSTSLPIITCVDILGVTEQFAVRLESSGVKNAVWVAETEIGNLMNTGIAKIEIRNIKDIFGNELVNNSQAFVITSIVDSPRSASDLYVNDKVVVTGDYISNEVREVKVGFVDDVFLTTYNVLIQDWKNDIVTVSGIVAFPTASIVATASYVFNPAITLAPGRYSILVQANDLSTSSIVVQVSFLVSGETVTKLLSAPNPFNPNKGSAYISYYLSQPADTELRVYSISGELLFNMEASKDEPGAQAGYNEIIWNGRNKFGEVVSNGVYLGYLIIDDGKHKTKEKVKIAVLK